MSASLLRSVALLLVVASSSLAHEFTGDNDDPLLDPFTGKKTELFRTSREAKGTNELVQNELQQQNAESGQLNSNQVEQQQQQQTANELPTFSSGGSAARAPSHVVTESQLAEVEGGQSTLSSSTSKAAAKKSASSKTITTTTTTTTSTQNNQDQPQVAQIREIRVHTVPLSEAVHYANYMVVPTSSHAANLEESSSSSSSSSSSQTSKQETEQVSVARAPTVIVNPPPAAVAPDCVLHRLIVERPASSQLVVNVAPEVVTSQSSSSSSSSRSSKLVSQTAAVAPETTVYTVRRVFAPPVVQTARLVAVPAPAPASREESSHFESRSSRHESNGVGHSMSSSSSSRTSKSSTTTTSQTSAALLAPPPPVVRTVTTVVEPSAPMIAVKTAPLVEVSSGRTNDVSVNVDHRQSGPNYNYGYSIKQHSSEPSAKGVVVGDRVVYLK